MRFLKHYTVIKTTTFLYGFGISKIRTKNIRKWLKKYIQEQKENLI
jgi:hypothetical protein